MSGPRIVFDFETITVSAILRSTTDAEEFIAKIRSLLPLMAAASESAQATRPLQGGLAWDMMNNPDALLSNARPPTPKDKDRPS